MPKILDWAVQGAKKWIDGGLGDPPSVVQATQDYQYKIDPNDLWIKSRHTSDEKNSVPCAELYKDIEIYSTLALILFRKEERKKRGWVSPFE